MCVRERGLWRLQLTNLRCAVAGVVVGALSSLCTDSSCGALCRWRQAKTLRTDTMDLHGFPATNTQHWAGPTWRSGPSSWTSTGIGPRLLRGGGFRRVLPSTIHASRTTFALQIGHWTITQTAARHAMSGPLFRLLLHIETSFCFDVQQQGKGRCMKHGHAPWGLRANDRLEPSPRVADVMQFGRLMAFLVIVLCWKSPEHPVVHRHHPLPSAEIGTSIGQFSGDELHTLHLDVFRVLTLRAPWLFVDFGLLDAGRKAKSQILTETLSRIRRMLSAWYHVYENKLGDDKVTRVGTVFNNLTGSDGERVLRLKAAQTKHFLPFVMDLRRRHRDQLQEHVEASALLGAGDALLYMDVVKRESRQLSKDGHRTHVDCCGTHNSQASLAGIRMKPKHQLFWFHDDAEWEQRESPTLFDLL